VGTVFRNDATMELTGRGIKKVSVSMGDGFLCEACVQQTGRWSNKIRRALNLNFEADFQQNQPNSKV
jgi:hypothetical protein